MKKLLIILLIPFLLLNCRSKQKAVLIEKEKATEAVKTDTNTVISEEKKLAQLEKEVQKTDQKEKDHSGDITITGKTDEEKDFHFHNVVNGDTISDIFIKGNADFVIKNKWKVSEKKEAIETIKENLNIVQEIARKSVAQSTIKEVAKEMKKVEKQIESKGFVFPVYLLIGFSVLFLILLFFLWRKFGGTIWELLNKKR